MKSLMKIDKAMETMTLCIEAVYQDACKQRDAAAEMVDLNSDDAESASGKAVDAKRTLKYEKKFFFAFPTR